MLKVISCYSFIAFGKHKRSAKEEGETGRYFIFYQRLAIHKVLNNGHCVQWLAPGLRVNHSIS